MKHWLAALIVLLSPMASYAGTQRPEAEVQQKFVSGGTVRMHLEAGGYTVRPSDGEDVVVTYRAKSPDLLRDVKVEIKVADARADVYVSHTPHDNFEATIDVPRRCNLWARLSAGELKIEDVEGDKNVEALAGEIEIEIPHPEMYGHRDASVMMGSVEAPAFEVSKGGLFRSFSQLGPGKYRLHAHVFTGEVDLQDTE